MDASIHSKQIEFNNLPLEVQQSLLNQYPGLAQEVEVLEFNFHWFTRDTITSLGFNPWRGISELYTVGDLLKELKEAIPNLKNNQSIQVKYPDLLDSFKEIQEKAKTLPKELKVTVC